jgi:imidazolonepropionase
LNAVKETNMKLTGPFRQLITLDKLPLKGPVADHELEVIHNAGILFENGIIKKTGDFNTIKKELSPGSYELEQIENDMVALPGFIDCHTHICYAGSREKDYAKRVSGISYLEIARQGGGIWYTVTKTRAADIRELQDNTENRANELLKQGITTAEVKSGYCLNVEGELKMLRAINQANANQEIDLIPTCLAAHMPPKDFNGSPLEYLEMIIKELLPVIMREKLTSRVDIFVEEGAFSISEADAYLKIAKEKGFDIIIHADQFSVGGSKLAVKYQAKSADHLEVSSGEEIKILARSDVIPVALPGASVGLGTNFAPARKMLDKGTSLAISTDWNPGSAPMGDLLVQAAILGAFEKLTIAETLAGITFRAAAALNLSDRGILSKGMKADMIAFECKNYEEIFYYQGALKPSKVWKSGQLINNLTFSL